MVCCFFFFFFQAEDGIRDAQESRGLGDVYKRQVDTTPFLATILRNLPEAKHVDVVCKMLYALAELSDQRNPSTPRLSSEMAEQALGIIGGIRKERFLRQYANPAHRAQLVRFCELARKMIQGLQLTNDEAAMLMESRATVSYKHLTLPTISSV